MQCNKWTIFIHGSSSYQSVFKEDICVFILVYDSRDLIIQNMCLFFSPFPLAERSASSRDEAAVILVLLSVVLQEGVLVPVQVVHQVAIATVLCHQVQRA